MAGAPVRSFPVAVHAVPESVLRDAVARRLPPDPPPAPWATRLDAVLWWHRAAPAAVAALAPELRDRPRLPLTVAGFVRYRDTPVGAYREVLATPALLLGLPLPSATIPFIAVDSLASIAAGRANWSLPKTLARFEPSGHAAHGDGWSVTAEVRPLGPALPFAALASNRQIGPDGDELEMRIRGRGRARPARADVRVEGPGLPAWLRAGRHPAIVVRDARVRFAAPVRR